MGGIVTNWGISPDYWHDFMLATSYLLDANRLLRDRGFDLATTLLTSSSYGSFKLLHDVDLHVWSDRTLFPHGTTGV